MFTGLVEAVGRISDLTPISGGVRLGISCPLARDLAPGDSLAVNGVCLTAVTVDAAALTADVGPETLRVTTLGTLAAGSLVNLERPLRADSRLGGHFVQGHVDGVGRIDAITPAADFQWVSVRFPAELAPYLILKGSIAVDGISLTVARLHADRFEVQVVPFTLEHTNLSAAHSDDQVNLECDMIGKYVVRAVDLAGLTAARASRPNALPA
jgi:riboflavin synthase